MRLPALAAINRDSENPMAQKNITLRIKDGFQTFYTAATGSRAAAYTSTPVR
jgi:hypothetical protein